MLRFKATAVEGKTIVNQSNSTIRVVVRPPIILQSFINGMTVPDLGLQSNEKVVGIITSTDQIFLVTHVGNSFYQRQLSPITNLRMSWGSRTNYDLSYNPIGINFYPYVVSGITDDDYTVMLGMFASNGNLFKLTFNCRNNTLITSVTFIGTTQLIDETFTIPEESSFSTSFTMSLIAHLNSLIQASLGTIQQQLDYVTSKVSGSREKFVSL